MDVTNAGTSLSLAQRLRQLIPAEELVCSFTRSGGPGGQNVNKCTTRATLAFDLDGSPSLTPAQKRRIHEQLSGRISKEGVLRVVSMRHRTQRLNRLAATDRFFELLAGALHVDKPRTPTSVPRRAKHRRLADKRLRAQLKRHRGRVSGDPGGD